MLGPWEFAITTWDGQLLAVAPTVDEAFVVASFLTGDENKVTTDSALGMLAVAEGEPVPAGYRRLAANPSRVVDEALDKLEEMAETDEPPVEKLREPMVRQAVRQSGLGIEGVTARDLREVVGPDLRDVSLVRERFEDLLLDAARVATKAGDSKLRGSLLGTNFKTSKEVEGLDGEILGLSLVPFWRNVQAPDVAFRSKADLAPAVVEADFDFDQPDDPSWRRSNWCVGSSRWCRRACLIATGQNPNADSFRSKYRKAQALRRDPLVFIGWLAAALNHESCRMGCDAGRLFIRLNMLSDLPWETLAPGLFELFPQIQFYDYTKVDVVGREFPDNYDMTYSFGGSNGSARQCRRALEAGFRVAVVFVAGDPARSPFQTHRQIAGTARPLPKALRERIKKLGPRFKPAYERSVGGGGKRKRDVAGRISGRLSFPEVQEFYGRTVRGAFGFDEEIPIVDGDASDFRPLDPPVAARVARDAGIRLRPEQRGPSIVALSYKGPRGVAGRALQDPLDRDPAERERAIRQGGVTEEQIRYLSGFCVIVPVRRWGEDEYVTVEVPNQTQFLSREAMEELTGERPLRVVDPGFVQPTGLTRERAEQRRSLRLVQNRRRSGPPRQD